MKNLAILAGLALLISACSPKYYSSNTQNVPLISAKGEKNLSLAGNGNQIEFQGAMGVSNNIAIKANGAFFIPAKEDNGNGGSGKLFEVGGGYFTPINQNFVFETYAILGFGSMKNHFEPNGGDGGDISANVVRYGIQPNFGYKSKNFEAAISSRFVNLNYNGVKGNLVYQGNNQVTYLEENNSNFLIEPALTLRAGFEKLKFQAQIGHSFNLSNNDFRQDKDYVTVGLNYRFK
ncbi:hypothetical protein [Pedobacter arcticus]|uniref:hypothetical protein n=1 Tax=Pedobacter arcticus TaxID=752140 RepID=UPI00030C72D9|nr:hypothetical protein [Pedobacter arcticus]